MSNACEICDLDIVMKGGYTIRNTEGWVVGSQIRSMLTLFSVLIISSPLLLLRLLFQPHVKLKDAHSLQQLVLQQPRKK